jgi:Bacterial Ig-like domain (group 3)
VDAGDNLYAKTLSYGAVGLYADVGGASSQVAIIWTSTPAAPLTVTLSGSTATIAVAGQTASGTIPSSLLSSTQLGFYAPSPGFVISSLVVSGGSQATATSTTLAASNTMPAVGASVILTANVAPAAATGTVTFFDGTTTLGPGTLLNGVAIYTVSAITAGTHSYTASYGGNTGYLTSTSSAVIVTATSSSYLISTTFNEYSSGHALNGTTPAVDGAGSSWVDTNGDWSFGSGGIVSGGTDFSYPALIDTGTANYSASFTYPAVNATLLFRYVDAGDNLFLKTLAYGAVGLYADVGGASSQVAIIWTSTPAAPLTVTLSGSTATIAVAGQTASGTIPSSLLSSTQLGFYAPSPGFVISSLVVSGGS